MTGVLTKICTDKRAHVAARKAAVTVEELAETGAAQEPPRGFRAALERRRALGAYGLVAEIKKASPSKGLIRADFDVPALARAYHAGGAACLSVLTDGPYFQGKDSYLAAARAAAPLPVLRKDFMLDPYQVAEARAIGADCILLILAALTDAEAAELEQAAAALGMDVLIEVHDESEMERAHRLDSRLIGINNRNLKSLAVDLSTTERLAPMAPEGATLVCESGLARPADLARMSVAGADCFLVGESLMRQADVAAATVALLARENQTASA
ncbi:MAG TPA: indole-3-glycerol phosphate synthase TrpC [Alphaproteobacteria bacterium]|nr:indole-3-glycerol phosphate synthase TrpC [Alphaproteobacteria bacterium]